MDDGELAGEWMFDPAHTRIGFSARHAMVTTVRGAFNDIDGRVHVDPADPRRSTVRVRLAAASVDTRHTQRDTHLRSPDFFDVERHPDIMFTSTMVDEVEDRMFMVVGDLTIRGTTHEVAIPIELRGVERGADGELRAGFEGSRRVDRRQWGLAWQVPLGAGGVLVSERVTMEFEISAVKVTAEPAAADRPGSADPAQSTEPDGPAAGVEPLRATTGAVRLPDAPAPAPAPPAAPAAPTARGRHRATPSGWFTRMRRRD